MYPSLNPPTSAMPKGIDLPRNFGLTAFAETFIQFPQTEGVLIDDFNVVGSGFIRLYPSEVQLFKLSSYSASAPTLHR